MKDQLLRLLELQKIDARVLEIRASMAALPEKLKPAQKDLAKLETMLEAEKSRIAETESWRKEQEQLIAHDEDGLKKAKAKVQQAKSSKDFAAGNREVDNKRRAITDREEEVLKVIEAMEQTRSEVEAHEKDVETLRQHVAEEEKKIADRVAELEAEATEQASGRGGIAEGIDDKLLSRYETIIKRRGIAVVPVIDGTCQGCHMAVPPQLNNILARGETIETCPRCQRMLYRQDWLEEKVAESSGSSS